MGIACQVQLPHIVFDYGTLTSSYLAQRLYTSAVTAMQKIRIDNNAQQGSRG